MEKQLIMSLLIFISAYGFGQTTQNSAQKPVVKKTTTTTTKAKTTKAKKTKKTVSLTKGTTTANSKVQPKTMPKTTTARTNTTAPNSSMGTGHAISTGAPNSTGGKPHLGGDPGTGTITPVNPDPNANNNSIIPSDAASAIKQALSNGITTGVSKVSVTDGYFANNQIKIPFPQDASLVETTLREVGLGSMIDNVTLSINRAAESAAVQATPIFVNAITGMTITDALNIVGSTQPDAATQFLKATTTEQLVSAFKPSVSNALNTVNATKYWSEVMGEYNKIPLLGQVNTDLPDYVTRQAISGLFVMIAKEEANIRKNPLGQTSPIIKKVFGSVKPR